MCCMQALLNKLNLDKSLAQLSHKYKAALKNKANTPAPLQRLRDCSSVANKSTKQPCGTWRRLEILSFYGFELWKVAYSNSWRLTHIYWLARALLEPGNPDTN